MVCWASSVEISWEHKNKLHTFKWAYFLGVEICMALALLIVYIFLIEKSIKHNIATAGYTMGMIM